MWVVKLAKNEDKEIIINLYQSLIGMPGCAWSVEYPTVEDVQYDIDNSSLYCLCDSNGSIVAVATAEYDNKLNQSLWNEDMKNHCELARVGVEPALQNQGLGKLIVEYVINDAKKQRFDGIRMLVSKTNQPAVALYEKLNFQCCGEIKMYGNDWCCYELVLVE